MSDEKIDLVELGKNVAKVLKYETAKAEREARESSDYIVEEYNPANFNAKWQEVVTYKNNMFAAISHGKELSYDNISNDYRVTHKKNGIRETVWHS